MSAPPPVPVRVNPLRSFVREGNTVLSARTFSYHEPGFRTTLSVKSVASGVARYGTPRSRYRVDPSVFALLNNGQEYTLDIQTKQATETCAVFFAPGFVEGAADVATRTSASLLDDPVARMGDVEFVERLYPKTGAAARALERLMLGARAAREGMVDELELEQGFHDLAGALLELDRNVRTEIAAFPGRKPGTRLELYRRLHHAHDVIQSCYREPLSIEALARHACMAPHHFLRMYRRAFGCSPGRALQLRRMEVALRLLETTDRPIQAVALGVGLQSAPSFARLFRRTYGCSPTQARGARSSQDRIHRRFK